MRKLLMRSVKTEENFSKELERIAVYPARRDEPQKFSNLLQFLPLNSTQKTGLRLVIQILCKHLTFLKFKSYTTALV